MLFFQQLSSISCCLLIYLLDVVVVFRTSTSRTFHGRLHIFYGSYFHRSYCTGMDARSVEATPNNTHYKGCNKTPFRRNVRHLQTAVVFAFTSLCGLRAHCCAKRKGTKYQSFARRRSIWLLTVQSTNYTNDRPASRDLSFKFQVALRLQTSLNCFGLPPPHVLNACMLRTKCRCLLTNSYGVSREQVEATKRRLPNDP